MKAILKNWKIGISLLLCLQSAPLISECCTYWLPHQFYIGPEVYHLHRFREGGTEQNGVQFGVRAGYDYIKRNWLYVGIEGMYASGRLHGHSSSKEKLKSNFRNSEVEGRLGFTLMHQCCYPFYFTPFFGGGYVDERNHFVRPSPLTIHYDLRYGYVCAGFLSNVHFCPNVDFGINFKTKYMLNAKNDVTHDPDFEDTVMHVKDEFHYRIELPLTYRVCDDFYLRLVPFYEYRHYGGKVNFPFDFVETRLHMAGATLKFMYCI